MPTLELTDLPSGELVLLCPTNDQWPDGWDQGVESPVSRAIDAGVPVVYVECGGFEGWGRTLAGALGNPDSLCIVDDEDDMLWVPPRVSPDADHDNGECWSVGSPTFPRITKALTRHSAVHGPCELVIDAIEHARPFGGIDEDPADPHNLVHDVLVSPSS